MKKHRKTEHISPTEAVYNFTLNQFFDWLGPNKITAKAVKEYDEINPKNKRNRISAIRQYCREHNIEDPYIDTVLCDPHHTPCDPTQINARTRKVYAAQAHIMKEFCDVHILTEKHVNIYIESRRGKVTNFEATQSRLKTIYNWYKACIEQGFNTDPVPSEKDRQNISDKTRSGYVTLVKKLIKWSGTKQVTKKHFKDYLEAHKEKWGASYPDHKVKMGGAYKWYLDCQEKGISIEYTPPISFEHISPKARETYAMDWQRVVKWCRKNDISEKNLEDFIRAHCKSVKDEKQFTTRFIATFKWYAHCTKNGLSIKRNERTIDGLRPRDAIKYEQILRRVVTFYGHLKFSDREALESLGKEYHHKIELFKTALDWRHTTKDEGLMLRLNKLAERIARRNAFKRERAENDANTPQGNSSLLLYSDHEKPLNTRVNVDAVAERCQLQFGTVEGYLRRVARFQIFTGSNEITDDTWQWFVKKECGSASSVAREKQALQWYCQDNSLPMPFKITDARLETGKKAPREAKIRRQTIRNYPPCVMCEKNLSNPKRGDLFTKVCDTCYEERYARTARHAQIEKDKRVRRAMAFPAPQKIQRNTVTTTTSWRRQS